MSFGGDQRMIRLLASVSRVISFHDTLLMPIKCLGRRIEVNPVAGTRKGLSQKMLAQVIVSFLKMIQKFRRGSG